MRSLFPLISVALLCAAHGLRLNQHSARGKASVAGSLSKQQNKQAQCDPVDKVVIEFSIHTRQELNNDRIFGSLVDKALAASGHTMLQLAKYYLVETATDANGNDMRDVWEYRRTWPLTDDQLPVTYRFAFQVPGNAVFEWTVDTLSQVHNETFMGAKMQAAFAAGPCTTKQQRKIQWMMHSNGDDSVDPVQIVTDKNGNSLGEYPLPNPVTWSAMDPFPKSVLFAEKIDPTKGAYRNRVWGKFWGERCLPKFTEDQFPVHFRLLLGARQEDAGESSLVQNEGKEETSADNQGEE